MLYVTLARAPIKAALSVLRLASSEASASNRLSLRLSGPSLAAASTRNCTSGNGLAKSTGDRGMTMLVPDWATDCASHPSFWVRLVRARAEMLSYSMDFKRPAIPA